MPTILKCRPIIAAAPSPSRSAGRVGAGGRARRVVLLAASAALLIGAAGCRSYSEPVDPARRRDTADDRRPAKALGHGGLPPGVPGAGR